MAKAPTSSARALPTLGTCVEQSFAADEALGGTATATVKQWLLIQHQQRWERKIAQTLLPDKLRLWLQQAQAAYPNMRVQLVRRDQPDLDPTARVGNIIHLIDTTRKDCAHRFWFDSLDALGDVAIDSLFGAELRTASGGKIAGEPAPPLYLVCTHGRRDPCCSRLGIALHQALVQSVEHEEVWHCSHLGGHRFAPTAVYLPQGLMYGRLQPNDAQTMVAAHRRHEIHRLESYRGLCRWPAAAQAGASWLRAEYSYRSFDALALIAHEEDGSGIRVVMQSADGRVHRLSIQRELLPKKRISSCEAAEATAAYRYSVTEEPATSRGDIHSAP